MRTYGTLAISRDTPPQLRFAVAPHVAIRLRRLFGGVQRHDEAGTGDFTLSGTPGNLVDVEWFLARYPLVVRRDGMRGDGRRWLAEAAHTHALEAERVAALLAGDGTPRPLALAIPPRDYQLRAAEAILRTGRLLIADELGLGKTITALTLLAAPEARPAVAVVPPHLAEQWRREAAKFLPALRTLVINGKTTPDAAADLYVVSYFRLDAWARWLEGRVQTVIFDEAQELRRRGSQKYAGARRIVTGTRHRVGLSATPIYNYGGEFWNVFAILAPDALGSREEFLAEWCGADTRDNREPKLRDPHAFGTYLREHGLMVRRTKRDVGRELPALSRVVETVAHDDAPLTAVAPRMRELARRILDQDGTPFELMRAAQDLSSEARQATGIAKAGAVADFVRLLVEETGERVVLFGWHRAVYDIWTERFEGIPLAWHTGTETPAHKRRELDRFIAGEARILIMSLRSGAGVDGLQHVCARAVIGELDWSPGVIEQCVGRLHRDGQRDPVFAYYLLAAEGSDPAMVDTLGLKRADLSGVRDPGDAEIPVQEADPAHIRRLAAAYAGRHATPTPDASA